MESSESVKELIEGSVYTSTAVSLIPMVHVHGKNIKRPQICFRQRHNSTKSSKKCNKSYIGDEEEDQLGEHLLC